MTKREPGINVNLNMEAQKIVLSVVNKLCQKNASSGVEFYQIIDFFKGLLETDTAGKYALFSSSTADVVTAQLINLEKNGDVVLDYRGGTLTRIEYSRFYYHFIRREYQKMVKNPDQAFPNEELLNLRIPGDKVNVVDAKTGLLPYLSYKNVDDKDIIRITFPGDVKSIIITHDLLITVCSSLAVQKIREYFSHKNNAGYLTQKLLPVCKHNETSLNAMVKMVLTNTNQAARSIEKPTDFSFLFWTQLVSFLSKELQKKENKPPQEIGFLQASYLIWNFSLYYKESQKNAKEKEDAFKKIGKQFRQKPYHYSAGDIYRFGDAQGEFLKGRLSKEDLHGYLEERIRTPQKKGLPEIIRLRTKDHKEYFIHREVLLRLAVEKVSAARHHYRKLYLDEWILKLGNFQRTAEMGSDDKFRRSLEKRIEDEDPLLAVLLRFELLYLAMTETTEAGLKDEVEGWFLIKEKRLKDWLEIFGLNRKEMLKNAASKLPFWKNMPLLAFFMQRWRSWQQNRRVNREKREVKKKKKQSQQSAREMVSEKGNGVGSSTNAAYKMGLSRLQNEFLGEGRSLPGKLDELVEIWNPLLGDDVRRALVEDVNSMIRDYLRRIRQSLQRVPPNRERVEKMAEMIAGNSAFSQIKERDAFRYYIELYIIKLLKSLK